MVLAILLGAITWTLAEYMLHRFVGHGSRTGLAFAREHLEHHRHRDYFAPWQAKLQLAVVVVALMALIILPWLGANAFAFLVSFVCTWLVYEAVHRDLHVRAPLTAFGRFLRLHHMHHHHVDARTNHGVTSAVWDHVWRTVRTSERIRVPAKKAPLWMFNPPPGAAWADDYEIVGKDHAAR